MTSRLRHCSSTASPASLPDDDNLLWEILLRLPPQPSSLPRASVVYKRWQRLVTDPQFLRRFPVHHRKPPLLGVFEYCAYEIVFKSIMDSPDRIPPDRFELGRCSTQSENELVGCWHGRVLIRNHVLNEIVVCAPLTGDQRRVVVPHELLNGFLTGAVVCAASDHRHVHGSCHSSPFKVVLVSMHRKDHQLLAQIYSSETCAWGNLISNPTPVQLFHAGSRAILVGNALYWLLLPMTYGILEFDMEKPSLVTIKGPPITDNFYYRQIIQANDGAIGIALLAYPIFQMWQRNVKDHSVAAWVLWKTIELHNVLGLPLQIERQIRGMENILGYSEDLNVIFISAGRSVYIVDLSSMESKRLYESNYILDYHHPFTSFYIPGATVASGCNGAKMLLNTYGGPSDLGDNVLK